MTIFDCIKSKNIDELAEWLNEHGAQDFAPWDCWFDKNYCKKCEREEVYVSAWQSQEFGWCELHNNKCKFFQDMEEAPWGKQLVKLWLESEEDDGIQN